MKKQIISLAVACAAFFTVNAQNMDHRSVVSANVGANLFTAFSRFNNSETFKGSATPTFQLSYDYALAKWFSLGAAVSFNSGKGEDSNYIYTENGVEKTGSYKLNVSRTTIGARALFHYGNSGRLDMYSGLRLGLGIWHIGKNSQITNFEGEDAIDGLRNGVAPQFQIVPFGLRYYVTNNLGLGFETAIGSPYYGSLQINYRLGGNN